MKKIIRNGIVKMDWDAEGFFESKSKGFIAATHVYETEKGEVPVVFQDKLIYILIDPDEGVPTSMSGVADAIKFCFKNDVDVADEYEDSYVELGAGSVDGVVIADSYGLTEDMVEDIDKRINDLMPYWEIVEEAMCD